MSRFNLKNHHTLALPAVCNNFYEVTHVHEISKLTFDLENYFILGGGSNVAFIDDFDGDIIAFKGNSCVITEHTDHWSVEADSGLVWHELVILLTEKGIGGLENLALIPGNCGAAAVQNIGAYGVEFKDVCSAVEVFDLHKKQKRFITKDACHFAYRNSIFKRGDARGLLITKIYLHIPKDWQPKLNYRGLESLSQCVTPKAVMDRIVALRESKLPNPEQLPNAGSFFKNPVVSEQQADLLKSQYPDMPCYTAADQKVKLSAGWLIEQAGFKGVEVDSIGTYKKHALVIVNYGNATGASLLHFVREIKEGVLRRFSVALENEVLLIGKYGIVNL